MGQDTGSGWGESGLGTVPDWLRAQMARANANWRRSQQDINNWAGQAIIAPSVNAIQQQSPETLQGWGNAIRQGQTAYNTVTDAGRQVGADIRNGVADLLAIFEALRNPVEAGQNLQSNRGGGGSKPQFMPMRREDPGGGPDKYGNLIQSLLQNKRRDKANDNFRKVSSIVKSAKPKNRGFQRKH